MDANRLYKCLVLISTVSCVVSCQQVKHEFKTVDLASEELAAPTASTTTTSEPVITPTTTTTLPTSTTPTTPPTTTTTAPPPTTTTTSTTTTTTTTSTSTTTTTSTTSTTTTSTTTTTTTLPQQLPPPPPTLTGNCAAFMNTEYKIDMTATNDVSLQPSSNKIVLAKARNLSVTGGAGDVTVRSAITTLEATAGSGDVMIYSGTINTATAAGGNLCLKALHIGKINLMDGYYQTIIALTTGDIIANGGGDIFIDVQETVDSVYAGNGDLDLRAGAVGPVTCGNGDLKLTAQSVGNVSAGNGSVSVNADQIGDVTTSFGPVNMTATEKIKSLKPTEGGKLVATANVIGAVDMTSAKSAVDLTANKIDSLVASTSMARVSKAVIAKLSGGIGSKICLKDGATVVDKTAYKGTIQNCK